MFEQSETVKSDGTVDEFESDRAGGVVPFARELLHEVSSDDVPGLAAEVAYHAIFSIPALIVVLITLAAVIDNTANVDLADRLQQTISESAPESTQAILTALVTNAVAQVDGGTASVGLAGALLLALWSGSNAIGVLVKAFNRAYDSTESRSFPRKKLAAVLLTIAMGLVVNLAFALWVFGGQIGSWIAKEFSMGSTFDWTWNMLRIPLGVVVILLMLGMLYYVGPTVKQEFRSVLPGATFSTAAWGALVFGFSLYLRFASPGSAYGALSGLIVFLFFLYLTAVIFLVGAELNAVLARRHDDRYQEAIATGAVEDAVGGPRIVAQQARYGEPSSAGSLVVGAVATIGIVLAAMLGRRKL
jgi:membrane protein